MICNFDETDILFVCFGIMEPLAAARQQQGTAFSNLKAKIETYI